MVVGGRCAFSARNLSPAIRDPRTAPMTVPTAAALIGSIK